MPTTWTVRVEVTTSWSEREKPEVYITPLEDAYTEVADEDNEIIYIYADSWQLIPATFWEARPSI